MRYTIFYFITALLIVVSCKDEVINPGEEETPLPGTTEIQPAPLRRMLWASINGKSDAVKKKYRIHNNKILVSWRMFPTDDVTTAFDLYRKSGRNEEVQVNAEPIINSTCFQDADADREVDNTYRLCYAGTTETLDTYTITAHQASEALPYIRIPLRSTTDIDPQLTYKANDASVGDLDGDGIYEIILKRQVVVPVNDEDDKGEGEGSTATNIHHTTLFEAYKLDGTFLWRIASGPNIPMGNSSSFAVYDFDGDGRCEVAFRSAEGTVFGDGQTIGDTDGDGKTDYRVSGANYIHGGPEFLSVVDGVTGKELARTDYIALGTSEDWGDNYYKRSSSYRISLGKFSSTNTSILICRGVYAKSVLEAWDFQGGKLTRRWRFDTTDGVHGDYAGQGNHSLSIGDVDDDGFDEVVYGACTIDHNGKGLNNSRFGHGDALHLGKFDPSRPGMQIWSCFETGSVGAAFRDARTGEVIWKYDDSSDVGRALVADIDPDSPGCEMWWFRSNAYSCTGEDLGYKPSSCNMAIWWSGDLNRQLLNESSINLLAKNDSQGIERIFTIYRYDVKMINGTKCNPCFYGDITGDWREEMVLVTDDDTELWVFSTWYPTEYKFPYLMSDHVYEMSAINQNVGYNQPTQLGYYLGSDLVKK
ncbi:hypothetical protein [uncultured Bacteroides sp.]|uniref:rhamnogalacturonan lyase family protein n=1 Tax=uncultured Bacteroides sp. TaxID=162156 RepID=UPI0025F2DB07|nr:hypothetical protein [uncultured Bacteroides sp.]